MFGFHADLFPIGEVKRIRGDNGGEYLSSEFKYRKCTNAISLRLDGLTVFVSSISSD